MERATSRLRPSTQHHEVSPCRRWRPPARPPPNRYPSRRARRARRRSRRMTASLRSDPRSRRVPTHPARGAPRPPDEAQAVTRDKRRWRWGRGWEGGGGGGGEGIRASDQITLASWSDVVSPFATSPRQRGGYTSGFDEPVPRRLRGASSFDRRQAGAFGRRLRGAGRCGFDGSCIGAGGGRSAPLS